MARQEMPRISKVREYAEIELSNGSALNGYVFVEDTMRIQDVLNGAAPFLPFVDDQEKVHLINKSAIVKLTPHDK